MKGTLHRFAYLSECTLGWLEFGTLRLASIERPWITNPKGMGGMPRLSCIPDGQYRVMPHNSHRFPDTYCIANELCGVYASVVPDANEGWGRSAVLIHAGNSVQDVIGCIAVGTKHAMYDGDHCILESRKAMETLRKLLGRTNHTLEIRPSKGTEK